MWMLPRFPHEQLPAQKVTGLILLRVVDGGIHVPQQSSSIKNPVYGLFVLYMHEQISWTRDSTRQYGLIFILTTLAEQQATIPPPDPRWSTQAIPCKCLCSTSVVSLKVIAGYACILAFLHGIIWSKEAHIQFPCSRWSARPTIA